MRPLIPTTAERFTALVANAQACRACPTMEGRRRILSSANGPCPAPIMLVGEAPGRLGAERTTQPFAGDESGRRLDQLLAAAGWQRAALFITNAVLCNPQDDAGRNRAPRTTEINACSNWLALQIEIVNPRLVVALGRIALDALGRIEPHATSLADAGSPPEVWSGRHLAAAYHPSPRATIHRTVKAQLEDFAALGAWWRASVGSGACR